jgi:hypothetical protein
MKRRLITTLPIFCSFVMGCEKELSVDVGDVSKEFGLIYEAFYYAFLTVEVEHHYKYGQSKANTWQLAESGMFLEGVT